MSILIENLKLNPPSLKVGNNTVDFTYDGFVTTSKDNPVTLTFMLADSGGDVVLISSQPSQRNFPLKSQRLSGTAEIKVVISGGGIKICNVSLVGVTALGASATGTDSFTY